jgi:hypothetical protein
MNSQEQKEYRALVRGVATYILLGDKNPPIQALELVQTFKLDLAIVNADIDAIVQSERRKVGGVFEATDQKNTGS